MILSGHQPNYWPYPGLIKKIMESDKFIYVTKVQFDKKSWQNRNRIKTFKDWCWITVPTLTKGKQKQNINEVMINNDINWRKKHFESIRLNYKKAPYFDCYIDFINELYQKKWERLSELNIYITNWTLKELDIKTEILYDKDYKLQGQKNLLLIDLCRQTGASSYLSNKGSQNYVNLDVFKASNIGHYFMNYTTPEYPQQFTGFISQLSILDLLLNCGKEKTLAILNDQQSYNLSGPYGLLQ